MLSLEMMNGDGMDRYCRVAFLLWRNEKLAGCMMVIEVEGLEWLGICWCCMGLGWVLNVEGMMSWLCLNGQKG